METGRDYRKFADDVLLQKKQTDKNFS